MFQLTKEEANETLFSKSQNATLKITRGENIKYLPYAQISRIEKGYNLTFGTVSNVLKAMGVTASLHLNGIGKVELA